MLETSAAHHTIGGWAYAWWMNRTLSFLFWTGGSVLVIGGVFPSVIAILIGAGYGTSTEDPYDLDQFRQEAQDAVPAPQADTAALDSAVEAALIGNGAAETPDMSVSPPAPVPVLSTASDEASATAPQNDDPKSFGGQFYPTTAHGLPPQNSSAASQ